MGRRGPQRLAGGQGQAFAAGGLVLEPAGASTGPRLLRAVLFRVAADPGSAPAYGPLVDLVTA